MKPLEIHFLTFSFKRIKFIFCVSSGADAMRAVARNPDLALTDEQRDQARLSAVQECADIYPFRPEGGTDAQVDFWNAITLVYEYIQATLGSTFSPADLYDIEKEQTNVLQNQFRTVVKGFRIPTPDGFEFMKSTTVADYWSRIPDFILDPDRLKKQNARKRQERRMMFCVAIRLHELGCLSNRNQATEMAKRRVPDACKVPMVAGQLTFQNAFPVGTAEYQGA